MFPDTSPEPSETGNPVIPVYAADPHAELFGDSYYIYATNAGIYSSMRAFHEKVADEEHGFAAWSSLDLRHWKSEGRILRFADMVWAREMGDAWAPCIAERNGNYFFYFCADSRIGVAVGDSPVGPFHDALGEPLVPFRTDLSSIDPMVFVDDDGRAYLYWGAVAAQAGREDVCPYLSVRPLNADMISFAGETLPTIESDPHHPIGCMRHIEASHLFKRGGIYYLMWSPGDFASDKDERAYRVHYATSTSPLGPWKLAPNNPVLSTRREVGVVGPGHHSTIQIPGTDEWYCVYHCHKGDVDRRTFIDRMSFDSSGAIETIVPTLEGPPLRPVHIALSTFQKGAYRQGEIVGLEVHLKDEIRSAAQRIEIFSGAHKIGRFSAQLSRFDWQEAMRGFHRLSARVTLTSGEQFTSAPLNRDVL